MRLQYPAIFLYCRWVLACLPNLPALFIGLWFFWGFAIPRVSLEGLFGLWRSIDWSACVHLVCIYQICFMHHQIDCEHESGKWLADLVDCLYNVNITNVCYAKENLCYSSNVDVPCTNRMPYCIAETVLKTQTEYIHSNFFLPRKMNAKTNTKIFLCFP